MKRTILLLTFVPLLLAACGQEEEMLLGELYKESDSTVVVQVGEEKLTVEQLKKIVFDKHAAVEINRFIEQSYLNETYPISDEEIAKEFNEAAQRDFLTNDLKSSLAMKKYTEQFEITEDMLLTIYEKKYKKTGIKYEEVKADIRTFDAHYYMHKMKVDEFRNNKNIKYLNPVIKEKAENQYNTFNPEFN